LQDGQDPFFPITPSLHLEHHIVPQLSHLNFAAPVFLQYGHGFSAEIVGINSPPKKIAALTPPSLGAASAFRSAA
jgi:hypothetical protein